MSGRIWHVISTIVAQFGRAVYEDSSNLFAFKVCNGVFLYPLSAPFVGPLLEPGEGLLNPGRE